MDIITDKMVKEIKEIETIIINTINGKFKFEKRLVKNFKEFEDVEQLLNRNTFVIQLENNRITFLVANVISIEITDKNYEMIYS